jgi:hypothetical protein
MIELKSITVYFVFIVSAKIGILRLKYRQTKITKLLTNVLESRNHLTSKIGQKRMVFGSKFNYLNR